MRLYTLVIFTALITPLMGCASFFEADRIITRDGLYNGPQKKPSIPNDTRTGYDEVTLLRNSYLESAKDPTATDKAKVFLDNGYAVVKDNCMYYFETSGTTQRWVGVTRDTAGAAGTLATGIMGALSAGTPAIAWVGLTTGAIYNGIDIYSKHFLFGAENIDAVKSLVIQQIESEQTTATQNIASSKDFSFNKAKDLIVKNQDVCTDAHILFLVQAAIKEGKPILDPDAAKREEQNRQLISEPSLQAISGKLGTLLGQNSVATDNQLLALLWLFELAPDKTEEFAAIRDLLGSEAAKKFFNDADPPAQIPLDADKRSAFLDSVNGLLATDVGKSLLDRAKQQQSSALAARAAANLATTSQPPAPQQLQQPQQLQSQSQQPPQQQSQSSEQNQSPNQLPATQPVVPGHSGD